jgi:hypothetical protein
VASALGLKRTTDAHAAFVRVLRSRPEAERAALSSRESQRLDQLEQRIRTRDGAGDVAKLERRLVALGALRERLA